MDAERSDQVLGDDAAQERFIEELIERGEAAKPDENGDLPPGATHELIDGRAGEPPRAIRRRFSLG
jgi:hypothetical protein